MTTRSKRSRGKEPSATPLSSPPPAAPETSAPAPEAVLAAAAAEAQAVAEFRAAIAHRTAQESQVQQVLAAPLRHLRAPAPLVLGVALVALLALTTIAVVALHVPFGVLSPARPSPPASPLASLGAARPLAPRAILTPPATYAYAEDPPASGPHYPDTWAPAWGFQDTTFAPEAYLSVLDRGGVIILYDCNAPGPTSSQACADDQSRLRSFIDSAPSESQFSEVKLVAMPYSLHHRYTLLAWGWSMAMDRWDSQAALAFYRGHVDQGPTSLP